MFLRVSQLWVSAKQCDLIALHQIPIKIGKNLPWLFDLLFFLKEKYDAGCVSSRLEQTPRVVDTENLPPPLQWVDSPAPSRRPGLGEFEQGETGENSAKSSIKNEQKKNDKEGVFVGAW